MRYANTLVSIDGAGPAPMGGRRAADLVGRSAATGPMPAVLHALRDAIAQRDRSRDALLHALDRARVPVARRAAAGLRIAGLCVLDRPTRHPVEPDSARDRRRTDTVPGPMARALDPVLLAAGSPIVGVPVAVVRLSGTRIVAAGRDAVDGRRAVTGALPFPCGPDQILVVTDDDGAYILDAAATARLLAMAAGAGDEILRFAGGHRVVTGLDGHVRPRDRAFGEATRDIFEARRIS